MAQSGQTLLFRFVAAVGDGGLQFGELFNELGGLGGHCVGLFGGGGSIVCFRCVDGPRILIKQTKTRLLGNFKMCTYMIVLDCIICIIIYTVFKRHTNIFLLYTTKHFGAFYCFINCFQRHLTMKSLN